ncbi:MAG: protein kinase [bacterium]
MLGRTISHYRIKELLGKGGMGVVYLAEDMQLGRNVALKFLASPEDHHYRARFLREARAVSRLSHPHIATLHDYGETPEGEPFIVMEFVNGQTLGEVLDAGEISLVDLLKIIESIAEALSAAHAQGIIHRDIKPSNVMVDRNVVKVLDFGLAKQVQDLTQAPDPEADTMLGTNTRSDVVVGTPLYLSPEQAMSKPIDTRSDLFALGALLYECITGRPAFAGGSVWEIGVQVIKVDPPRPSTINPQVPHELDLITMKALEKKPADRFQSAEEMITALKSLRVTLSNSEDRTQSLNRSFSTRRSNIFQRTFGKLRQPRASIAVLLLIALLSILVWFALRGRPESSTPFHNMQVTKLTNSGNSGPAAISFDGRRMAYVVSQGKMETLMNSSLATDSSITIVPADSAKYLGVTFSRDGEYIYYVRAESTETGRLYRIPAFGGPSKKLLEGVDSAVAESPDGNRLAFISLNRSSGIYSLTIANTDGSSSRTLATRKQGDEFSLGGPAWSPDGEKVVCAAATWSGGYHMNLIEVKVKDGAERPITSRSWAEILQSAWSEDGKALVIAAAESGSSPYQIWQVSYADGKVERITNDLNEYQGISLPADAKTIVSVQSRRLSKIWVSSSNDLEDSRPVASEADLSYGLTWTNDNKIVFSSMVGDRLNISMVDEDGSNRKQLTGNSGENYHPAVSPDGRYIVFASGRAGAFNIWRMNANDGGGLVQLTSGGSDFYPSCSPDSRSVVYEHQQGGSPTLWKIPIDGGQSVQLTNKYAAVPVVSPDGKLIACRYYLEGDIKGIALIPFDGGEPVKLLQIPIIDWQRIRWTLEGKALTYVDAVDGVYNLWSQPLDGGPPKQLTHFKTDVIFSYDWSAGSNRLACERGDDISDVVAIRNYR